MNRKQIMCVGCGTPILRGKLEGQLCVDCVLRKKPKRAVKDIRPDGTIVYMTAKEERQRRKRIKSKPAIIRENFQLMCAKCGRNLGEHFEYVCVGRQGEFELDIMNTPHPYLDQKNVISKPEKMTKAQYALWKAGHQAGIRAAAGFVESWDGAMSVATYGYRFSDMLLCKFNVIRRKKPRKVRAA